MRTVILIWMLLILYHIWWASVWNWSARWHRNNSFQTLWCWKYSSNTSNIHSSSFTDCWKIVNSFKIEHSVASLHVIMCANYVSSTTLCRTEVEIMSSKPSGWGFWAAWLKTLGHQNIKASRAERVKRWVVLGQEWIFVEIMTWREGFWKRLRLLKEGWSLIGVVFQACFHCMLMDSVGSVPLNLA